MVEGGSRGLGFEEEATSSLARVGRESVIVVVVDCKVVGCRSVEEDSFVGVGWNCVLRFLRSSRY